MAVDVSRIPNNNKFDPVREAILQLQTDVQSGVSGVGSINGQDGLITIVESGNITVGTVGTTITIGIDDSTYLTEEVNDLTAAVTWANVPDANITQSSVTQHQAALSITENQISDLQSYLVASDLDDYLLLTETGEQTIAGDIVISGDLTISGTTTYINTNHLNIGDNIIQLNADIGGSTAPTEDAGFYVNRGSQPDASFLWDEDDDRFSTYSNSLQTASLYIGTNLFINTSRQVLASGTISSTVPYFTFSGDSNTGVGRATNNKVSLIAEGTKVLEASDTGVDITGTLDVSGSITGDGIVLTDEIITSADFSATDNRFKLTLTQADAGAIEASFDDVVLSNEMETDYVPYVSVAGGNGATYTTNAVLSQSWLKFNSDTLELGTVSGFSVDSKTIKIGKQVGQNDQWITEYGAREIVSSISSLGGSATAKIEFTTAGRIQFNDEFTFPATDGTSGQVLSTDGSGDLSWVAAPSGPTTSDLQDVTDNGATTTNDISTGRITIANNVSTGGFGSFDDYQILLYKNGTSVSESYGIGIEGNTMMFNSDTYYNFYVDNSLKVTINSSGDISSTGNFQADGIISIGTTSTANEFNFAKDHNSGTIMMVENPNNGTSAYTEIIARNIDGTNDIRIGSSANYVSSEWQGGWVFATNDLLLKSNSNVEVFAGGTADSNIVSTFSSSLISLNTNTEITGKITITGSPAIELTGSGTGTYNKTVIYNDLTYGFLLEATKHSDSDSAAKKPITLTWRGGYSNNGGLNLTGDTKLFTDDTGLGVDITSPSAKLHVGGRSIFDGMMTVNDGNNYARLGDLNGDSTMALELKDGTAVQIEAYGSDMRFHTDNAHRMTITSGGSTRMEGSNKIEFNNSNQYIYSPDAYDLRLGAADDIYLESSYIRYFGNSTEYARIARVGGSWIDSDLNIGASSADGNYKLKVNGTGYFSDTVDIQESNGVGLIIRTGDISSGSNNKAQLQFGYNGTDNFSHFVRTRHNSSDSGGNAIDFYTCDSTEYNSITSGVRHNLTLDSGKVGIGLTNPSYKLHVAGNAFFDDDVVVGNGSSDLLWTTYSTPQGAYSGSFGWNSLQLGNNGGNFIMAGNNAGGGTLGIYTNVSSRYRYGVDQNIVGTLAAWFDTNGNMGVGTSSPSYKLDVNGGSGFRDTLRVVSGSTEVVQLSWTGTNNGVINALNGGSIGVQILGSGNSYFNGGSVGINQTSPQAKLHVTGDVALFNVTNDWQQSTY